MTSHNGEAGASVGAVGATVADIDRARVVVFAGVVSVLSVLCKTAPRLSAVVTFDALTWLRLEHQLHTMNFALT